MNINFDLTDKQVEFLKQYAKVYHDERKEDCTNEPIVVVEKEERIPTREGLHDGVQYVWIDDTEVEGFDTLDELEKALLYSDYDISNQKIASIIDNLKEQENIEIEELGRFEIDYYTVRYKPVAYFLTRAEAEQYCVYQKHNIGRARVYSRYMGYRNLGDLVELSKMLLDIGKMLNGEIYNG